MPYSRALLQQIAAARLKEAKLLIQNNMPSGAYYLAGYAIECLLKAKIAGRFGHHEIPDRVLIRDVYTHDLFALIDTAKLKDDLKKAVKEVAGLGKNWSIVQAWSEQARYAVWTHEQASAMIDAVVGTDEAEGLYQWLLRRL